MISDDKIRQIIKDKKRERDGENAELSSNSIEFYKQGIKRIYKNVISNNNKIRRKKLEPKLFEINKIDIINNIKEYENPKVKTNLYSSLYAFTNDIDYQNLAVEKQKEYQVIVKKQELSKTEKENWITREQFMKKLQEHKLIAENLWDSKPDNYTFSVNELLSIQNYIILVLVSHIYFPIRRSEDWTEMKIRGDIDRSIHNEIDRNKFIFNKFKTAQFQPDKRQIQSIKPALKKILDKWISINPNEYLLINTKQQKLNHTTFYQRLTKIFGKKVSINMLRKLNYTEGYGLAYKKSKEKRNEANNLDPEIYFEKIKLLREEANKIEKELAKDMKAGGSNIRNAPHYEKIIGSDDFIEDEKEFKYF
jgi:hypothetical protein